MADLELVRRLAALDGRVVATTTRADGSVHASVVSAGVLDDPDSGAPVVAFVTVGGSRKLPLLRRAGRAAVVFRHGFEWVAVEGPVQLAGPDDPLPEGTSRDLPSRLRDIFTAAGGTHDDWDEFDRAMVEEARTAVYVTPARISGNG